MNNISNVGKPAFGSSGSTPDANKLYSILLDTRASSVSESMYDIVEKILTNEKDNSKIALEQLWSLKKSLEEENEHTTIDLLIGFYQDKINTLRNKEEHIKRVSRDSRELLEEKRRRDSEIAMVKQEIGDCSGEIERLNSKLSELKVKEQELSLIENQLHKELRLNANEVVNGLYEIILSSQEKSDSDLLLDRELPGEEDEVKIREQAEEVEKRIEREKEDDIEEENLEKNDTGNVEKTAGINRRDPEDYEVFEPPDTKEERVIKPPAAIKEDTDILDRDIDLFGEYPGETEKEKVIIKVPFPKSVVKTTRGIVIGEYYYDPKVYKNKRHYIYNSNFFRIHLSTIITSLINKYEQALHGEAMQLIQDGFKRIQERPNLHFEVSTNEILNKRVLREVWQKVKNREYQDVLKVCNKLKAKIEIMGNNYGVMLTEQMARYNEQ